MTAIIPSFNYFQKIIDILGEVLNSIHSDTDVVWTRFDNPEELIADIKASIEKLKSHDYETLANLNLMFAPTGTFQELSIANGWGDRCLELSEQFDFCFQKLKAD